jgi:tRNA(Ile)-lysidine synthase
VDVLALAGLPRAVRTRVLRAWAAQVGAGPLSAERTSAVDALITAWRGQGPVDLPGGVSIARASGRLVAYPDPARGKQE